MYNIKDKAEEVLKNQTFFKNCVHSGSLYSSCYGIRTCHQSIRGKSWVGCIAPKNERNIAWLDLLRKAGFTFSTQEEGEDIKIVYYGPKPMLTWVFLRAMFRSVAYINRCLKKQGDPFQILMTQLPGSNLSTLHVGGGYGDSCYLPTVTTLKEALDYSLCFVSNSFRREMFSKKTMKGMSVEDQFKFQTNVQQQ